jgi:2-hydroxymuconate-semialdehyde hydrolase
MRDLKPTFDDIDSMNPDAFVAHLTEDVVFRFGNGDAVHGREAGTMGVAIALPGGLNTVWGYEPSVKGMREVIGLFAYDRSLITDELVEMRYRSSLNPPVRDSWHAMFPAPRQRWVDDLALSGAELSAIRQPVLMVHGRDDKVVPWQRSSLPLVDLLPDVRLHVIGGCGHWTMIEKTADFLAVVEPFLAG